MLYFKRESKDESLHLGLYVKHPDVDVETLGVDMEDLHWGVPGSQEFNVV